MIPEILDGPWGISDSGGRTYHGWVDSFDDSEAGNLKTMEVIATTGASIQGLANGNAWTITREPGLVFSKPYARHVRLDLVTTGAVPGGAPTEAGARPVHSRFGPRVNTFHQIGWYNVVWTSGMTTKTAYLNLTTSSGIYIETLYWPPGFARPAAGETWTITWRGTQPNTSGLSPMTSTITIL